MDINVNLLNAISKVFITSDNFKYDSNFNIFKTTNDVLQIDGKFCTKQIFDMHMEYMINNGILGITNESKYFLIKENNYVKSNTALKIYSILNLLNTKINDDDKYYIKDDSSFLKKKKKNQLKDFSMKMKYIN